MLSKTKQTSVFWRLLSYLKAYRLLTVLALSFLLLTTVVRSLIPLLASYFIDHYISTISETAVAILAAYFVLYLLQMALQYFGNLWFAKVSYSIVR
ncbi:ABC transporter ATP-binding protein, partial [Streptococcus suis]